MSILAMLRTKINCEATGEHFNLPGHSHTDMKFTIIEQVKALGPVYAREREKLHIKNLTHITRELTNKNNSIFYFYSSFNLC